MRIGKNIHSENRKKVYRKPVMEVVDVDRVIVLQIGQSTGEPFAPSVNSTNQGTKTDKPTYIERDQYPRDNNPFGGGSPDFER